MSRSFRLAAWVFLGTMLVQAAWVLAVPPFRGIDEFDHVYRAASVADGHWMPSGEVPDDGRGELVYVSPGIVRDAGPACSALQYTGPDNCNPAEVLDQGVVSVGSGAARYNPAFYFVVGSAAQPFDGAPAMYVMRAVNALLCSLLLASGVWATSRWARTRWPLVALLGVVTPVAVYSTSVPGPNGVEMCGAVGLWTCLLGMGRVDAATRRRLLVVGAACAVPLTLVRGLGPLWLATVVIVAWVHVGPRRTFTLLREVPRTALGCALALAAVGVAAVGWIVGVDSLAPENAAPGGNPVLETLRQVPAWFLQSLAAFPLRNEAAPMVVYATAGLALLGLLGLAVRQADRRGRLELLFAFASALTVPVLLTVLTYETAGVIWQGRYGWPLSMGVVLLAGALLDRRPPAHPLVVPGLVTGAVMWGVAHVVSVTDLAIDEGKGVLGDHPAWWTLPPWTLAALTVAGLACWWRAATAELPNESSRIAHSGQTLALLSTGDR